MAHKSDSFLILPASVVGRIEAGRLLREVQALDEFLTQMAIRGTDKAVKLPRTSRILDETIQVNSINPLIVKDRNRLLSFLVNVQASAPIVHISFSADPSPLFVQKLITWMRKELHPITLLHIGLQPTIGAGAIVRTNNKFFDLSLRHKFTESNDLLMQMIKKQPVKAEVKAEAKPAATTGAKPVATTGAKA